MKRKFGAINSILLAAIVAVVGYQSLYLLDYPQIDTGAWFGDESWTMLTLREMANSGVARIPEAVGSSISSNNGLVNGVVWIAALIYGLPATLLSGVASPVAVGRVVTLLVSCVLLVAVYRLLRGIRIDRTIALGSVLLLAASPVFFSSSHSARLDALTGLSVVVFILALVRLRGGSTRRFFWTGFFVSLSLAVYVHVPTLILLPWLYAVYESRSSLRRWIMSLAGAALGALVLLAAYYLSTGSTSLFGYGHNQYHSVVSALPILHPFSWQVQKINTIDRFIQVWSVGWPIVVMLIVAGTSAVVRREHFDREMRLTLVLSGLVIFGWMFFEGPAVFYEIHAAPVFVTVMAILLSGFSKQRAVIALLMLAVTGVALFQQRSYGEAGKELSVNNERAVRSLLTAVRSKGQPFVLADQPAWNIVAGTAGVRLMTTHVLLFGGEPRSVADILREHDVHYLLLYSTRHFQSPIRPIADSLYDVIGVRIGNLTDEAKGYEADRWTSTDTLRLYKARYTP